MNYFTGWKGSIILLLVYVASEFGFPKLGGDWSAFLYVTFHFVLLPILSLLVVVVTTVGIIKANGKKERAILFSSLLVPIFIIVVAVTGTTYFAKILDVDFNK
jgi:hypothetical protein